LTKKGGAVKIALDSKPSQYSVTESLEKHSILGLTAIRFNSALIFTVTPMSAGQFAPLEGCLCLLGGIIIVLLVQRGSTERLGGVKAIPWEAL
jgi:hypothetical protein